MADLQPLMQQLVFECKVHSVLYGSTLALLSRGFRAWQSLVEGERWKGQLRHAPADGGGTRLRASRELETFRSVRKELLRESSGAEASRRGAASDGEVALQQKLEAMQGELLAEQSQVQTLKEQLEAERLASQRASHQYHSVRAEYSLLTATATTTARAAAADGEARGQAQLREVQAELEETEREREAARREAAEATKAADELRRRLDAKVREEAVKEAERATMGARLAEAEESAALAEERAAKAEEARARAARLADELRASVEAARSERVVLAAEHTAAVERLHAELAVARADAAGARREAEELVRSAAESQARAQLDEQGELAALRSRVVTFEAEEARLAAEANAELEMARTELESLRAQTAEQLRTALEAKLAAEAAAEEAKLRAQEEMNAATVRAQSEAEGRHVAESRAAKLQAALEAKGAGAASGANEDAAPQAVVERLRAEVGEWRGKARQAAEARDEAEARREAAEARAEEAEAQRKELEARGQPGRGAAAARRGGGEEEARALHAQGLWLNAQGKVAEARVAFEEAAAISPARAGYVISAANMALKAGDAEAAVELYERARRLRLSAPMEAMVASKLALAVEARRGVPAKERDVAASAASTAQIQALKEELATLREAKEIEMREAAEERETLREIIAQQQAELQEHKGRGANMSARHYELNQRLLAAVEGKRAAVRGAQQLLASLAPSAERRRLLEITFRALVWHTTFSRLRIGWPQGS